MSNDIAELIGGGFNPEEEQPAGDGFAPLPVDWYPVEIEKSEIRDNAAKNGKYIYAELTVLGDKFANRKLFSRITLVNLNETAVSIGRRELSQLGKALGLKVIDSTDQLIGGMLQVKVKVTHEDGYPPGNEVTAYKAIDGVKPVAATPPPVPTTAAPDPAPTSTAAPAKTKKHPWDKS